MLMMQIGLDHYDVTDAGIRAMFTMSFNIKLLCLDERLYQFSNV